MQQEFAPTSVQDPLRRSGPAQPSSSIVGRRPSWVLRLARWLRSPGTQPWQVLPAHVDPCTGLLNRHGLLALTGRRLDDARRCGRPLALAVFDCNDLLEVDNLYGRRVSHELMDRLAAQLDRLAGATGLAARTGPAQFAVALPGLERGGAVRAIQRGLGASPCIDLDRRRGYEIVLVPDFLADTADGTETAEQLYRRLCIDLVRSLELQQHRCRHMRRERERHSQPMGLAPAANEIAFTKIRSPADTIPMPLPRAAAR